MSQFEMIIRALIGLGYWFDSRLEHEPDNDIYLSGKALCADAVALLKKQNVEIKMYKLLVACFKPDDDEDVE